MIRPIMGQNSTQNRKKTSFGSWEVVGRTNSQTVVKHLNDIAEASKQSFVYCDVEPHFVVRMKPKTDIINLDIYPVGKAPWYKRQNPKLPVELRPWRSYSSQVIDVKYGIAQRIEKLREEFQDRIAKKENFNNSIVEIFRKMLKGKKREEISCSVIPK